MVWALMGLLDEAIREHLELKRRRGADPGEVAREQREALDPVLRNDDATADDEAASSPGEVSRTDAGEVASVGSESVAVGPSGPPDPTPDADLADAGETAELDMRSVLSEQDSSSEDVLVEEEPLEWAVPGEPPPA